MGWGVLHEYIHTYIHDERGNAARHEDIKHDGTVVCCYCTVRAPAVTAQSSTCVSTCRRANTDERPSGSQQGFFLLFVVRVVMVRIYLTCSIYISIGD